jgi:hypothetical protein
MTTKQVDKDNIRAETTAKRLPVYTEQYRFEPPEEGSDDSTQCRLVKLEEPELPKWAAGHHVSIDDKKCLIVEWQGAIVATLPPSLAPWYRLRRIDDGLTRLSDYLDKITEQRPRTSQGRPDVSYAQHAAKWINKNTQTKVGVNEAPIKRPQGTAPAAKVKSQELVESNNLALASSVQGYTARVQDDSKTFEIYSTRAERSENASDFLQRVYAAELEAGELTLADLKKRDESLWRGLRNWAHAGRHNLDSLIPRGSNPGGRPALSPAIDAATLNPDDPRDALALQALRHRASARESARRRRAATPRQH